MLQLPKLSPNDASQHSFFGEFPPSSFGLGFHGSASKKPKPSGVCTATLCQESVAFCPISSAAVIGALHELPRVSRNLHFATFVRHYVPPGRLGNVQLPPSTALRLFASRRLRVAVTRCRFEQLPHSSALPSLYRYHRFVWALGFSHEFQALPSLLEQPLHKNV
jgi:hypothetical protein